MRAPERFKCGTMCVDHHQGWHSRKIAFKTASVVELRNEHAIGHARRVAKTEVAALLLGQHEGFKPLKTVLHSMPVPVVDDRLIMV